MTKSRKKKQLKKKPTREREGDPWFNTYRYAATQRAQIALGGTLFEFEQQENRQRKRTSEVRQWMWETGYALLADLTHHYLNGSPGNGLVVPRAKSILGKHSRYHRPFFTRSFPRLLDDLEVLDYLRQTTGKYSGLRSLSTRTTIRAGARLIELIEKHALTFADLAVSANLSVREHWV